MNRFSLAVASVSLLTPSIHAAFDGPYAPEFWTFTPGPGGSIDSHTANTLVLIGGDSGFGGDTDITIAVAAPGTWSFDWNFEVRDTKSGFDVPYYLINGIEHGLFSIFPQIWSGSESVQVNAGDTIGFRVETTDGFLGPGILTITNFSAPVPGPGTIALLTPLLMTARRRHRGDPTETRRPLCTASH